MSVIRVLVLISVFSCWNLSVSAEKTPYTSVSVGSSANLSLPWPIQNSGAPYPHSEVITGFTLDWPTHRRFAQGSDNFQLTWADDNHLYGAWGDGGGFGGTNSRGRVSLGIARIEGLSTCYKGFNVWGGYNTENPATFEGKSWGMICIEKTLFMWIVPDKPEGKDYRNHYEYIELARSTDHGATWTKANWKFFSIENLTIPTFLNFGKANANTPTRFGDYVYSYFIHPESHDIEQQGPKGRALIVHKPGVIYLARASVGNIFVDKANHEFFRGLNNTGDPLWGTLNEKVPVFEDSNGVGWCLSASYNPNFQQVLLSTQHGANGQGTIGIFAAPNPWGPWTTVEYYNEDSPFGQIREGSTLPWNNNTFFVAFATKWFDGDTFTLNFTGAGLGKDNDSFNTVKGTFHNVTK